MNTFPTWVTSSSLVCVSCFVFLVVIVTWDARIGMEDGGVTTTPWAKIWAPIAALAAKGFLQVLYVDFLMPDYYQFLGVLYFCGFCK